ncbi:DUF7331 family protein [Natronomonas marina]|jgi:hypothetical protein|uniref:DUF7331 family protein n=1 Tax=Natronomonas marina TaxID=2961939 RepID=UPI0020CA089E|nr:hypothetical protein [Natronomonas marina]
MSDIPSERSVEGTNDHPKSPLDTDRYAHLSLDDDAVVIYDREEPDTWVQSDFVVEIGV